MGSTQHSTNVHAHPRAGSGQVQQRRCASTTRPRTQHRFVSRADHAADDPRPAGRASDATIPPHTLLVIETCDVAGWVHDIAVGAGHPRRGGQPLRTRRGAGRRSNARPTRTMRSSSRKLAVLGQLPTVHMPSPQQRQRRRLVHYRRVLVERRTADQEPGPLDLQPAGPEPARRAARRGRRPGIEQIAERRAARWRSAIDRRPVAWPAARGAATARGARPADRAGGREARRAGRSGRSRASCCRRVPGVGPRLAETVVAHLDDPHRFKTAGQVASYAGLVPKQFESGTMKRSWPDHPPRAGAAARDAGRGGVDGLPAQRLGEALRRSGSAAA